MKFLIFLGSVRDSTPPQPARLGLRVSRASAAFLEAAHKGHEIELVDPLDFDLGPVFKPNFAWHQRDVPADLDTLAKKIQAADAYVMVSPEYNHSMSPALANLLNHFGSSLFAFKPSTIVTYSAGQWGGIRAAVAMRTFLSEIGCLPVSAMVHVPKAQEVFNQAGEVEAETTSDDWGRYFDRAFSQMVWWAAAARQQRDKQNPHELIGHFQRDPAQRNAP